MGLVFLLSSSYVSPEQAKALAGKALAFMHTPNASGFVYHMPLKDVTGGASLDVRDVQQRLQVIRRKTQALADVGFGVREAQSAAMLARQADAVVAGSAIVSRIAEL